MFYLIIQNPLDLTKSNNENGELQRRIRLTAPNFDPNGIYMLSTYYRDLNIYNSYKRGFPSCMR
jgi:hypothetical protein